MGRFYKTAKPEMMDFMFKVPEQAIMTAIKGADAQLEGQEAYLTDLQKQLKTAALEEDEVKRKQRVTELEGKIREHSLKIFENPLLAIKEQKGIRDLGQEIYKDLTEGELYAYNTNYATRKAYEEKVTKEATDKDGRLNVQQVKDAMGAYDAKYAMNKGAQFNKETGKFNPYGTELLYDYVDPSVYAKETANGWESTKTKNWYSTPKGNYWYKITKETDVLELDDLTMGILNTMENDENVTKPIIQNLQHKATVAATARAKETGESFDELYNEAFNKLYTNEFGEIDPATKQLKLEQVLDEKGQPVINEQTKKPVMRFVNPGKLYRIAQAAADKKDKNDITTGDEMTGADPFAMKAQELANAKALEDYKNPIVWDKTTGEFIETMFEGNNVEEAETNLDGQRNALETSALDYKNKLLAVLGKGKSQKELEKLKVELGKYFERPTLLGQKVGDPDFNGLAKFMATQGFSGDPNLTSVDDFKREWESTNTNLRNKQNALNLLREQAKNNLNYYDIQQQTLIDNDLTTLIAEKQRLEANYYDPVTKEPRLGMINSTTGKQLFEVTDKIKKLQKDKDAIVNKYINLNVDDPNNINKVSFGTYQTAGEKLKDFGASNEDATAVQKALADLGKESIFSLFGGASANGTFVRNSKGTGMVGLKGTTLGGYFTETDKYDYEYNPTTFQFEVKSKADGEVVFKGNVGNYRLALENLDKVGKNAVAVTINGSQINPITKKRESVSFDLYTNQLKSNTVSSTLKKVEPQTEMMSFTQEATRRASSVKSPKFEYQYNKFISYYPNANNNKGIYVFYDDNKNEIGKYETANEALGLFETLYKK